MPRPLILVVDDDVEVLEDLDRALRAAGYDAATARSGEDALLEAQQSEPDLIVADVIMPGLNGFQMCRKLKAEPATRDIPVILISGKVDPADRFWAQETGALALFPKPVDRQQLIERIQDTLQDRTDRKTTKASDP
jgi:CheY-like chemotaxis protein